MRAEENLRAAEARLEAEITRREQAERERDKVKEDYRKFVDLVVSFLCRDWELVDGPDGARLSTPIADAGRYWEAMTEIAKDFGGKVTRREYPKTND